MIAQPTLLSIEDLVTFCRTDPIHLNVYDGGLFLDTLKCSSDLVCALVICCGNRVSDLKSLREGKVDVADLTRAMRIIDSLSGPSPTTIDAGRILRDPKYACQVQEMVTVESASKIVEQLRGHLVAICVNPSGCRLIQKLLEVSSPSVGMQIMHSELSVRILEICGDVNGNHVVQKFIDLVPSADSTFIIDRLREDFNSLIRLSCHGYGCRVIQRLMTKCDIRDVGYIFDSLCATSDIITALSEDVFGNYVMQQAIEFGRDIDRERIGLCFASHPNIVQLGCSKFASNVVEKYIRFSNKRKAGTCVVVTKLLLNALLALVDPITGEPGLLALMKDRYGNYVVRAIIELTSIEFARETMIVRSIISDNSHVLKKFTFSWHLVERLEKLNSSTDVGFDE